MIKEVNRGMIKRCRSRGQATVEYVLIIAVILAALIVAISGSQQNSINQQLSRMFTKMGNWLTKGVDDVKNPVTGLRVW